MSRLARLSDDLRALQVEAQQLDVGLHEVAVRDLAQLRAHYEQQLHGPDAARARRRLALVAEAERRLREGRAQLQQCVVHAESWLALHGAAGGPGDGGGGGYHDDSPLTATDGSGDEIAPSDAIYALVHRANWARIAGESVDAAMDELDVLLTGLDANDQEAGSRYQLAASWQGQQDSGRNTYADDLRDPAPDSTYVVDGPEGHLFQFETDGRARTVRARTTLQVLDQPRAEHLQGTAKRRKGGDVDDDGGHLIARQFGGPGEEINVVPQDWFQNQRGDWRQLEREWRSLLDQGFDVEVEVEAEYDGASARPTTLVVRWAFRHPNAPQLFEWVKDTVRIANDHAAGPRHGMGLRPG